MSNIQNVFFSFQYLQQFYCLMLIYQQRPRPPPSPTPPLIKATDQQLPSLPLHPHPFVMVVIFFFFNIVFILFFFFSFFYGFKLRYSNPNFIKRLKYTLDYIERGEFTVLQDVIKITTLETLNKGQRNVDGGGV